jgi:two-component system chemotaxis response regulator CheY
MSEGHVEACLSGLHDTVFERVFWTTGSSPRVGGRTMTGSTMRILIAEDFATMRRIIKNVLRQAGYEQIIEAEDGTTALRSLKSDDIDLVIADWNMPNMTGLDLLKAMRSDDALKDIPFLMVTAEAKKDNIIEAIQSGASNYLVKPFTPEMLREKIDQVLTNRG